MLKLVSDKMITKANIRNATAIAAAMKIMARLIFWPLFGEFEVVRPFH